MVKIKTEFTKTEMNKKINRKIKIFKKLSYLVSINPNDDKLLDELFIKKIKCNNEILKMYDKYNKLT